MGREQPNTLSGLVPKTLKNPCLAISVSYYSDFYSLYKWIPLTLCWREETLEALCFMNLYVLIILAATRANHIYRKVITYTGPLPCLHAQPLCQYTHKDTSSWSATHTYSLIITHTLTHTSILSCWTWGQSKCQCSQWQWLVDIQAV